MCYIDDMTERLNIIGIEEEELGEFRLLSVYSGLTYGKLLGFLVRYWKLQHPKDWEAMLNQQQRFSVEA